MADSNNVATITNINFLIFLQLVFFIVSPIDYIHKKQNFKT